jgi:hypothetical protein
MAKNYKERTYKGSCDDQRMIQTNLVLLIKMGESAKSWGEKYDYNSSINS